MLRIYDTKNTFLKLIDKCKDACVISDLKAGTKTLSFKLPQTDENLALISEEYYVETADYRYVIKEVNMNTNSFFEIHTKPDLEGLKMNLVPVYDVIDINIEAALKKAVLNTGWIIDYQASYLNAVEYHEAFKTPFELIEMIKEDFDLEVFYETKEKKVSVFNRIGKDLGTMFSNELKLKLLKRQGQSYDFCTVLYPIGKDNLTIGSINNSQNYIENYQYCDKYLPKYWIQDDIEEAQQLKMMAEAYLAYYSMPIVGYQIELASLPKGAALGDNILMVDKLKRIKQRQRIVKVIQYPFEPERDKVEINNQIVNFAQMLTKFNSDRDKQIAYIKENLKGLL